MPSKILWSIVTAVFILIFVIAAYLAISDRDAVFGSLYSNTQECEGKSFSFQRSLLGSAAQQWKLQEAAFGDWTSSVESELTTSIVDTRPTTTAKRSKMSQTPSQQGGTYDGAYGSPQPIYYNNSGQGYEEGGGGVGQGGYGYGGQPQQQVSNYAGGAGGDQPPVETEPPRAKIASPMVGVGLMAALTFLTVLSPMIVFLVLYTDATTIF